MRTILLLGLLAIAHSIDKMSGSVVQTTDSNNIITALILIVCVVADISEWVTNLLRIND